MSIVKRSFGRKGPLCFTPEYLATFAASMAYNYEVYETVIGLEVHAQLLTESKLFCGDSAAFGAPANTHISAITMGHPGTLPKTNEKSVEYAVKMGLACHCEIERENYFARKNYFYPDLPKGYQLSQHTTPICKGGYVTIRLKEYEKQVRLNRIHMEEDAGKSMHEGNFTSVDYNRAGVPLIEIVTEPDLSSGDEAYAYLTELRKLLRYLEVCDGNMEEGSMRCDANISVRKKGDTKLGTKVEVKNLNSIRNVKRAIEIEAKRMIELLEDGKMITQQTRSYDADNNTTFAIRDKEDADDYRYFPEPDLTKFILDEGFITSIQQSIPALHYQRIEQYQSQFNLSVYDATLLTEEKEFADYFEALIQYCTNYKSAANWMTGPVKSWLNENGKSITAFPVNPAQLAGAVQLTDDGKISFSVASTRLFTALLNEPGKTAAVLAEEQNLLQTSDSGAIEKLVDEVLAKFPDKVLEYQKGKKGLIGLFMGEVKKLSKGKADPQVTTNLLTEKLKLK